MNIETTHFGGKHPEHLQWYALFSLLNVMCTCIDHHPIVSITVMTCIFCSSSDVIAETVGMVSVGL